MNILLFVLSQVIFNATQANVVPESAFSQSEQKIRVRIASSESKIRIRGFDLRFHDKVAANRQSVWNIYCQSDRVRAVLDSGEVAGAAQKASEKSFTFTGPVSIRTPAGFLSLNGKPFREELVIHPNGSFCEVVNHVGFEKYLEGLVNTEFSSKWDPDAIAAQVIAARTYAYFQILAAKKRNREFDVEGTVSDQVYNGFEHEDHRAARAVKETQGTILALNGSKAPMPIKAFYHSTCGGKTELPQKVWGGTQPGFTERVTCPFCKSSPRFNWDYALSVNELKAKLIENSQDKEIPKDWPRRWKSLIKEGELLDLVSVQDPTSGRVAKIHMVWNMNLKGIAGAPQGEKVRLELDAGVLRNWLGTLHLRSTRFEVSSRFETNGDKLWVFSGHGNGHGVGMCQWGAKSMGEQGYNYTQILKYYYPNAFLRRLEVTPKI